jgi:DNA polymerase
VRNPGERFRVGKHLVFKSDHRFLMMKLPSGRILRWYKPRVEEQLTPWGEMRDVVTAMGIDTFTRKWQRSKIIGSSFYQSSVQATAADIMREGCMALEAAGYPLRMRIHDEFLSLRRIGEGSVEEMISIISKTPDWAPGLPINGEGWEGPRFKKG